MREIRFYEDEKILSRKLKESSNSDEYESRLIARGPPAPPLMIPSLGIPFGDSSEKK
jgi:hypothetical protein